ncbi:MAG: DnaA regulatory inactivator Hda [Gammaproteobacteria bacterium]|nr:DnaA regulatory inactivator Hda [Gammaproteobacteria bacterium]
MSNQIPLSLMIRDEASFGNFYTPGNEVAFSHIKSSVSKAMSDGSIFVWGSHCSGKTHILQAACLQASQKGMKAAYIPLEDGIEFNVNILDALENFDLVCIDDIDAIAGSRKWEQAIFYFYNRAFETGTQVIISGRKSLKETDLVLPDLISRLSWGFVFHLQTLTDENKSKALQARAKLRGFELPDNVVAYLLRRIPRDMNTLFKMLDELDLASLSAKRPLSIPIVKEWFDTSENANKILSKTE